MSRQHPSLPTQRSPAALPSEKSTASFWHTAPSPLLTGHRSTRELPKSADVVIIGSGMSGTSAAYHLLAAPTDGASNHSGTGLEVVMLEAREACWGATGRNGGHCQPLLFETPTDASIGEFELKNFHTLQDLIEDRDIDCEFVAQPGVRAIYSEHHLQEAEQALSIMDTTAPHLRRLMTLVTDKAELEKYRVQTAQAAIVTSIAARMWPYKFVAHMLEFLLAAPGDQLAGALNLQALAPATAIARSQTDQDRPWSITTPRGAVAARAVILATNAYTSHLLPEFADLIVPCRGQMSALRPLPSLRRDGRLKTSLGFLGDGLDDYLVQRPSASGGHLMFGGGRQHGESVGATDDSVLDPATAAYLRRRLVAALSLPEGQGPAASDVAFEAAAEWTGIMGFSRDERPWVGAVPDREGVFVAAGFTGHGMPNTWLCGKAAALMAAGASEEAAGRETGLPECYRLSRGRMERAKAARSGEEKDWAALARGEGKEESVLGT